VPFAEASRFISKAAPGERAERHSQGAHETVNPDLTLSHPSIAPKG
jgi:hypothetical protein